MSRGFALEARRSLKAGGALMETVEAYSALLLNEFDSLFATFIFVCFTVIPVTFVYSVARECRHTSTNNYLENLQSIIEI